MTPAPDVASPAPVRYTVRTMADALKPQPPVPWIVQDIIRRDGVTVFAGQAGSKKTYSLLWLAVCVAMGIPWLGKSTRQAKVLIVDEESGERRLSRRLAECCAGAGGDEKIPLQFICQAGFDLRDDVDAQIFKAAVQNSGAELVIIDSLAMVMAGGDENSVKDVQPVFLKLRQVIKDCGCGIALIHHAGKNGDSRGSSAINGACDLLLLLESKPDSPNVDFSSIKARDTEPVKFAAVARWEPGQFSMFESVSLEANPNRMGKAQNFVLEFIRERGAATIPEIQASADVCSAQTARQAVYDLAKRGIIGRTNKGAGVGEAAIYAVVEN
jgi:predicted ATP-dependent serine protease